MQQIQLNIIPFRQLQVKALSHSMVRNKEALHLYIGVKLWKPSPKAEKQSTGLKITTDFQAPREGAITTEIKFADAINFSLHYFRHLVFNYFKSIEGAIVFPNYVDDIEVWFKDPLHKKQSISAIQ
ncbi:MAG: hypothetical protein IPK62_15660 [Bacteroidetes bacterium]|nr:hypothetical protein [Bacteroidota bacterium]